MNSIEEIVFGKRRRKTRSKIPKGVRVDVWNKYVGKDKVEGKCFVCNKPIRITNFEVGHNKAVSKGGSDRITNLRPICRKCNLSMGTMSIEAYKKKYYSKTKGKKRTKKSKKRRGRKRTKTPLQSYLETVEKATFG